MARSGRALRYLTTFFIVLALATWGAWWGTRTTDATWLMELAGYRNAMTVAAMGTALVWGVFLAIHRVRRRRDGDNLRSVAQFQTIIALVIVAVVAAGTFGELSTTVLSLGLVGFGLTLALQRPILALAGWATVFFGNMFREGDRIQVGDLSGDVLAISLMTTRLWEVGNKDSNTPGRPTGRLRTVSNAIFLEQPVANATSDTPTIFDEFVVNVAFESDQEKAQTILKAVGSQVLDSGQHERLARTYRRLTQGMPMEANFPQAPFIMAESRPSWMEYRLRYLVDAREAARVQSALTKEWNTTTAGDPSILMVYPRTQHMAIDGTGRPVQR